MAGQLIWSFPPLYALLSGSIASLSVGRRPAWLVCRFQDLDYPALRRQLHNQLEQAYGLCWQY